jgi:hypothetical protein
MTVRKFIELAFKDKAPDAIFNYRLLSRDIMKVSIDKLVPVANHYGLDSRIFLMEVIKLRCRVCGCTDDDCSQCIEKTGGPCTWVEEESLQRL